MDWVLIGFASFKGLVFITGMYFAIKWHYDRDRQQTERRVLLRAGARFGAIFMVLLLALLGLTFGLAGMLGMDLRWP